MLNAFQNGPIIVQYRVCPIYKESNILVISYLGGQKSVHYRVCSIFDILNVKTMQNSSRSSNETLNSGPSILPARQCKTTCWKSCRVYMYD